jgi:hypothetical protein
VKHLYEWNTCYCRYHTELRYLLDALNEMRIDQAGVYNGCTCTCLSVCGAGCQPQGSSCVAPTTTFLDLTLLWSSILCEKGVDEFWHSKDCLFGNCADCGVTTRLRVCGGELSSEKLISWRCFGQETIGVNSDGRDKKVVKLEYKETTTADFIDFVRPKLSFFVKHNFLATWQDAEFKEQLSNLPACTILTCVDFSENYSMKLQNEIQIMHWHCTHVTILVMITYRKNPAYDLCVHDFDLLKDVHYFILDDPIHDTGFVQHSFLLYWDFMKGQGRFPTHHVVWSDGAASQFKSARAWYFVARYPSLTCFAGLPQGCNLTWNFFASGHGKGEVDGVSALCKREIRTEQMKPNAQRLQDAKDVVAYLKSRSCRNHAACPGARKVVNKHFWLVGATDVVRSRVPNVTTIPGSRSVHQV